MQFDRPHYWNQLTQQIKTPEDYKHVIQCMHNDGVYNEGRELVLDTYTNDVCESVSHDNARAIRRLHCTFKGQHSGLLMKLKKCIHSLILGFLYKPL